MAGWMRKWFCCRLFCFVVVVVVQFVAVAAFKGPISLADDPAAGLQGSFEVLLEE